MCKMHNTRWTSISHLKFHRGQAVTWSVVIAANVRSASMLQYVSRQVGPVQRSAPAAAVPPAPAAVPLAPAAVLPTIPHAIQSASIALGQLAYWMNIVLSNNLLPSSQQHVPIAQTPPAPNLRPASTRPLPPLHATRPHFHPYNVRNQVGSQSSSGSQFGSASNNRTSRDLIGQARSVLDVTNAEPLFYVGTSGRLLCRCCVDSSGFEIPNNVSRVSPNNPNRTILTDAWREFKKRLRKHLLLPSHVTKSREFYQRQGLQQTFTRADTEAGLTLIRMVYENIKTQRSYTSFSDSCAMRFLEGAPIGFQNHSAQFPAAIVDCSYDVLNKYIFNK